MLGRVSQVPKMTGPKEFSRRTAHPDRTPQPIPRGLRRLQGAIVERLHHVGVVNRAAHGRLYQRQVRLRGRARRTVAARSPTLQSPNHRSATAVNHASFLRGNVKPSLSTVPPRHGCAGRDREPQRTPKPRHGLRKYWSSRSTTLLCTRVLTQSWVEKRPSSRDNPGIQDSQITGSLSHGDLHKGQGSASVPVGFLAACCPPPRPPNRQTPPPHHHHSAPTHHRAPAPIRSSPFGNAFELAQDISEMPVLLVLTDP